MKGAGGHEAGAAGKGNLCERVMLLHSVKGRRKVRELFAALDCRKGKKLILFALCVCFGCKIDYALFACMAMEGAGFWRKVLYFKNPLTC